MGSAHLRLPTVVDTAVAQSLKSEMLLPFYAGEGLSVDASEVERISTPGLQLLWSAAASFRASGLDLSIQCPSQAFLAALSDAALDLSNTFQSDTGIQ